jgi:hypothetical protein
MQDRSMAELDYTKRRAIVIEELRYLAGVMRHVPFSWSGANEFTLFQPQVRNNLAYRASDGPNQMHWWLAS